MHIHANVLFNHYSHLQQQRQDPSSNKVTTTCTSKASATKTKSSSSSSSSSSSVRMDHEANKQPPTAEEELEDKFPEECETEPQAEAGGAEEHDEQKIPNDISSSTSSPISSSSLLSDPDFQAWLSRIFVSLRALALASPDQEKHSWQVCFLSKPPSSFPFFSTAIPCSYHCVIFCSPVESPSIFAISHSLPLLLTRYFPLRNTCVAVGD